MIKQTTIFVIGSLRVKGQIKQGQNNTMKRKYRQQIQKMKATTVNLEIFLIKLFTCIPFINFKHSALWLKFSADNIFGDKWHEMLKPVF